MTTPYIDTPIVKSRQEQIKESIATILNLELTGQRDITRITGDDTGDRLETFWNGADALNLFIDRGVTLDDTELNGIVVNYAQESFEPGSVTSKKATARYQVAVIVKAKSTDSVSGDVDANITGQRISKMIRAILMSQYYRTLGYTAGTVVEGVGVGEISVEVLKDENSEYLTAYIMQIEVRYVEPEIGKAPVVLERLTTTFGFNGRFLVVRSYTGDVYPDPEPEDPEDEGEGT